ncbi:hypothetical protein TrRE_jg5587 [Triparma retinervis]|uniref:Uncharacterized protein n=1 Tax=Triparma retinervis TaxID=2557542 RepID=A0A9W7KS36_9STRA|nr:hypothetical protein TrRE_jg5587 [Triparma retinervis]
MSGFTDYSGKKGRTKYGFSGETTQFEDALIKHNVITREQALLNKGMDEEDVAKLLVEEAIQETPVNYHVKESRKTEREVELEEDLEDDDDLDEEAKAVEASMKAVAEKFKSVKFLKIRSKSAIERWPDANLPTVFCYVNGEMHKQMIGSEQCGGPGTNAGRLEWRLKRLGVLEDSVMEKDAPRTKGAVGEIDPNKMGELERKGMSTMSTYGTEDDEEAQGFEDMSDNESDGYEVVMIANVPEGGSTRKKRYEDDPLDEEENGPLLLLAGVVANDDVVDDNFYDNDHGDGLYDNENVSPAPVWLHEGAVCTDDTLASNFVQVLSVPKNARMNDNIRVRWMTAGYDDEIPISRLRPQPQGKRKTRKTRKPKRVTTSPPQDGRSEKETFNERGEENLPSPSLVQSPLTNDVFQGWLATSKAKWRKKRGLSRKKKFKGNTQLVISMGRFKKLKWTEMKQHTPTGRCQWIIENAVTVYYERYRDLSETDKENRILDLISKALFGNQTTTMTLKPNFHIHPDVQNGGNCSDCGKLSGQLCGAHLHGVKFDVDSLKKLFNDVTLVEAVYVGPACNRCNSAFSGTHGKHLIAKLKESTAILEEKILLHNQRLYALEGFAFYDARVDRVFEDSVVEVLKIHTMTKFQVHLKDVRVHEDEGSPQGWHALSLAELQKKYKELTDKGMKGAQCKNPYKLIKMIQEETKKREETLAEDAQEREEYNFPEWAFDGANVIYKSDYKGGNYEGVLKKSRGDNLERRGIWMFVSVKGRWDVSFDDPSSIEWGQILKPLESEPKRRLRGGGGGVSNTTKSYPRIRTLFNGGNDSDGNDSDEAYTPESDTDDEEGDGQEDDLGGGTLEEIEQNPPVDLPAAQIVITNLVARVRGRQQIINCLKDNQADAKDDGASSNGVKMSESLVWHRGLLSETQERSFSGQDGKGFGNMIRVRLLFLAELDGKLGSLRRELKRNRTQAEKWAPKVDKLVEAGIMDDWEGSVNLKLTFARKFEDSENRALTDIEENLLPDDPALHRVNNEIWI